MCEFVNFSIAKKLKEKGFDKYCSRAYSEIGCFNDTDTYKSSEEFYCYAPTISQVLKWLREEKRIYVGAEWVNKKGKWIGYVDEMNMPDLVGEYIFPNTYDSYELAALAGVEYCLDNLI